MELLLVKDVTGLGARGDLVTVARGYARNYLLPRGLAQEPDEESIRVVRARAEKIAEEQAAVKAERMAQAQQLASVSVRIVMKAAEGGNLYGSVGARQIADALTEQGHEIEEKHVLLEQPLKEIGEFDVSIGLHPEVSVPVKVAVVSEEE